MPGPVGRRVCIARFWLVERRQGRRQQRRHRRALRAPRLPRPRLSDEPPDGLAFFAQSAPGLADVPRAGSCGWHEELGLDSGDAMVLHLLRGCHHIEGDSAIAECLAFVDERAYGQLQFCCHLDLHLQCGHGLVHVATDSWSPDLLVWRLRDLRQVSVGLLVGQLHLHSSVFLFEALSVRLAAGGLRRDARAQPLGETDRGRAQALHPSHRVRSEEAWHVLRQGRHPLWWPRLAHLCLGRDAETLGMAVLARHLSDHRELGTLDVDGIFLPQERQQ
mmetsp:Transcript_45256/g.145046  ORF Transcript_45256/g.145046 Transcript_45256/m.145046 type:complete len:276 (-) Transcript_45256:864-1691(-)